MPKVLIAATAKQLYPFAAITIQELLLYVLAYMHPEAGKSCTGLKLLGFFKKLIATGAAQVHTPGLLLAARPVFFSLHPPYKTTHHLFPFGLTHSAGQLPAAGFTGFFAAKAGASFLPLP
jgi:hypothetical protein